MTANQSNSHPLAHPAASPKQIFAVDIAALAHLLRAATLLPWTVAETDPNDGNPETVIRGWGGRAGVAVTLDFGANNPLMRDANSHLIVSAVNAVPALIALARELEQKLAAEQPTRADVEDFNPVEAIGVELARVEAGPDPRGVDVLIEALDCTLHAHGFEVRPREDEEAAPAPSASPAAHTKRESNSTKSYGAVKPTIQQPQGSDRR